MELVNTNVVCNIHLLQADEFVSELSNELSGENRQLNTFEQMSLLHKETNKEKLGQRCIDVTFDWTKYNDELACIYLRNF